MNDALIKADGTPLFAVFFPNDEVIDISHNGVESIFLYPDGNGLSGHYDRIHIFGEKRRVFIAHNVDGFEIIQEKS